MLAAQVTTSASRLSVSRYWRTRASRAARWLEVGSPTLAGRIQQSGRGQTVPRSGPADALILGERRRILLDPASKFVTHETVGHDAILYRSYVTTTFAVTVPVRPAVRPALSVTVNLTTYVPTAESFWIRRRNSSLMRLSATTRYYIAAT